ncbi:hypothetical protein ADK57_29130 [Streptomyces sp. MMG1533]|uniref:hypothetical protein n=1 Tax=Streptomyces sp. MMG1533 TaxID=1415546 RepID=UPI0003C9E7C1|nr:hypothetical protein [Streptomyces sp. MMG1533]AGZ94094.1 hypothetical protein [Streptomyces sp. MMG1533]KOU60798.1 hypothetical protein ADK57_29130 [Streptomyces sp. MMG1533]
MEIFVTVAVILAMIALGVLLIHLLNSQHDQRIAAFRYSSPRPALRVPAAPRPWKSLRTRRRVRKGQRTADAPDR